MDEFELARAIGFMDLKKVKQLLATGLCSLNGSAYPLPPPIVVCVNSGVSGSDARRTEILKLLLSYGAKLCDVQERGMTLAMLAAMRGDLSCLKILCDSGETVAAKTPVDGETALTCAAHGAHIDCVKFITENINVSLLNHRNAEGKTALMLSASGSGVNSILCLQHLVAVGADIDKEDVHGHTALLLAAKEGRTESLKFLSTRMTVPQINHVNDEGRTALMLAASEPGEDSFLCLEHMVTVGADIDVKDKNGYTALMYAIETGFTKAVRFLLKKEADFTTMSASGDTPLLLAFRRNLREIVTELQGMGALFSTVTPSGHTFLSEAFERERRKDVTMLLRQGVDPTVSRRDRLCLHTMVARGPMAVVRALVMHGFPALDLECRDLFDRCMPQRSWTESVLKLSSTPMSPLALAIIFGRPDVARYFIASRFLTRYDLVRLGWDPEICQWLREACADEGTRGYIRARMCLTIVDFLTARPQPLRNLVLTVISSTLSQDLVLDPPDSLPNQRRWTCRPTFLEKVERLEIPPALKRDILHQSPISRTCCGSWHDIPLEKEWYFPVCHCKRCRY